jgi:hypothetical protein
MSKTSELQNFDQKLLSALFQDDWKLRIEAYLNLRSAILESGADASKTLCVLMMIKVSSKDFKESNFKVNQTIFEMMTDFVNSKDIKMNAECSYLIA